MCRDGKQQMHNLCFEGREMTEIVNILNRKTPEMLLFVLMVKESDSPRGDLDSYFNLNGENNVEVELKVNGVELKFTPLIERLCEKLDEHILEKAKELLSRSRLEKLEQILSEAEWKIEQELEKLMKDEK